MKTILALVTTSCHNCPPIKKYIQNHHIDVGEIVIMDEDHLDFIKNCKHWGANKAPTVLLIEGGKELARAHDLSGLKELIKVQEL